MSASSWRSIVSAVTPKKKGYSSVQMVTPGSLAEEEAGEVGSEDNSSSRYYSASFWLMFTYGLLGFAGGIEMIRSEFLTISAVLHSFMLIMLSLLIIVVELVPSLQAQVENHLRIWSKSRVFRFLCLTFISVSTLHAQTQNLGKLISLAQYTLAVIDFFVQPADE
jgi:hypothetical protein